jgi:hypothetical protein
MASKSKRARTVKQRNLAKDFMYWAITVFIIKLIIIGNVQGGAWLGADGENYLKAADGLIKDGFFSTEVFLSYWPAGYPMFIYGLSFLGVKWSIFAISFLQSAVYSYAVYFFAKHLLTTKFKGYAYFAFILILLNPTLSLSSIAVGYESFVASGLLIVFGLFIKSTKSSNNKILSRELAYSAIIFFGISMLQPRFLLPTFITLFIWSWFIYGKKAFLVPFIFSLVIVSIAPTILILRNQQAMGFAAISTNLGGTMNIGAGDKASGAYTFKDSGVPCTEINGNAAQKDQHLTQCVIKWYLSNPDKALQLAYNKTKFFWSPWYGPEANGSMARNPWLKINPLKSISEGNPDGMKLIYGGLGKLISYLWILGQLFLMFYGFIVSRKLGRIEWVVAIIVLGEILISWLISIGTLGDHRQRLPIMGMSLFLQAVGIRTLLKGGKPPMVDGPGLR